MSISMDPVYVAHLHRLREALQAEGISVKEAQKRIGQSSYQHVRNVYYGRSVSRPVLRDLTNLIPDPAKYGLNSNVTLEPRRHARKRN